MKLWKYNHQLDQRLLKPVIGFLHKNITQIKILAINWLKKNSSLFKGLMKFYLMQKNEMLMMSLY